MNLEQIISDFKNKSVVLTDKESFEEIQPQLKLLEEFDTFVGGIIRLFTATDIFLFQETTKRGEIAFRKFDSVLEARSFISERMETYDNMWNGCGCKVDYYA